MLLIFSVSNSQKILIDDNEKAQAFIVAVNKTASETKIR